MNKKGKAFPSGKDLAQTSLSKNRPTNEERLIQERIETLEYIAYAQPRNSQANRRPQNRQRLERQKSWRLALEAMILTLAILALVGALNQRFHFLW